MATNFIERVVWSPLHGGCLMIQRKYLAATDAVSRAAGAGRWINWTSGCEGEYPTLASAQRAVERSNNFLAEHHTEYDIERRRGAIS